MKRCNQPRYVRARLNQALKVHGVSLNSSTQILAKMISAGEEKTEKYNHRLDSKTRIELAINRTSLHLSSLPPLK